MHHDLPPPTLVENNRGFDRFLADLDRQREIAVDTEADSFFSYHEKVCLIQVTVEDRDYLLDPLAGFDLAPLGGMLADPRKLKVFHDGEYDVLILKRAYGFTFKNMFDTRVAAATLGSQAPGLASVLKERFDIELDKSMQRSNWSLRPLSDKQIRYARLDTHFLLPLMREQKAELEATRKSPIVEGECRRLEELEPPQTEFDPDEFVRIKGARTLDPLERQILRELFALREKLASESDQPPFRVINNETLLALTRARPRSLQELQRVAGFSWKQGRKLGDELLAAVARGIDKGPLRQFPMLPSRDGTADFTDQELELHERLKQWRTGFAAKMDIEAAYVLNRHVLLRLARERPLDRGALERVRGFLPWQLESFGDDILSVVKRFDEESRAGSLSPKRRRARWRP